MKKIMTVLILLGMLAFCWAAIYPVSAEGTDLKLENPPETLHVDLMEALENRQSTRGGFLGQEIASRDLAALLWAANGINRKNGQRTAPAALGKYFINLYVAANQGVYKYEPDENLLKEIAVKNIKGMIGGQTDIGTSSHVLVLVADLRMLPAAMERSVKMAMAHGTAGAIAENVYLVAAALKVGTRLVAGIKENNIRRELHLADEEIPLYIMPLGYVKEN